MAAAICAFFYFGICATYPHLNFIPWLISSGPAEGSGRVSSPSAPSAPLFLAPLFAFFFVRSLRVSYAYSADLLVEFRWGKPVKAIAWAEIRKVEADRNHKRKKSTPRWWLVLHTGDATMVVDPQLRQNLTPVVERIDREIADRPELLRPESVENYHQLLHQYRIALRFFPKKHLIPGGPPGPEFDVRPGRPAPAAAPPPPPPPGSAPRRG